MSHFAALIIGPYPEAQLDPYWEIDLSPEAMREDYRAEFVTDVAAGDLAAKAREIVASIQDADIAATYREMLAENRIEEILANWIGGEENEAGDWGHYRNPQAKWDWNVLGGRWQGSLHLLPGRTGETGEPADDGPVRPGTADQARYGDVDRDQTRPPAGKFTPFAVLKYGAWHEQGRMGWFGIADNQMDDAAWEEDVSLLLTDVPADTLVSVFDCHL
jgi:hypothetical protein